MKRIYGTRVCIGCEREFVATNANQKRCKPRCGYFTHSYRASRPTRSHRADGLQFIGLDGEGVTDADGTHRYVLLSVGSESLTAKDDGRLTFHEIMPFLWEQYEAYPHAAFVGFYLSYDFSQWFRDMPEDRARYLFTEQGRALRTPKGGNRIMPFPVRWAGWEFDVIGKRRFKLRPCPGDESRDYSNTKQGWMYICDSGPFWQTSLLSAINPKNWGEHPIISADEWDVISKGKANRATAKLDKTMIRYNVTENEALARAMGRLEQGFAIQGWNIKKSHWFGPGQAAQLWLNSVKAPTGEKVREKVPELVLQAAQSSYYGGWFEIPRHGYINGPTYEYDINSAYPFIISQLPCLLHGSWVHRKSMQFGQSPLPTLLNISSRGSDAYLGGLPHRNKDGIISRPHNVTGWYWMHEIEASMRAGLIDSVTINDAWQYEPCKCLPPLRSIARLYETRLEVGKNTAQGKALKLVYNSAYGKMAQSIGEPKYANAIYASLITAGCRTMILDAIATHPNKSKDVLMVATDGIYFKSPHPTLSISEDTLGLWDTDIKNNLCLFMPGVYWDDKARDAVKAKETVKMKSRGINGDDLAKVITMFDDDFQTMQYYKSFIQWPFVDLPIRFNVTSPALALARNKWNTCGLIKTYEHDKTNVRSINSNPINKRDVINHIPYYDDGILTTHPYDERGINYGYNKSFGKTIEAVMDNDEHMTDDGTIVQEIIELLGGHE